MPEFSAHQRQIEYLGVLSEPAFSVWTNPHSVLRGLYQALAGLYTEHSAFRMEGKFEVPLERGLLVDLGEHGTFRMGVDRIELVAPNYTYETIDFAKTVERGAAWLRTAAPELAFQSHYFTINMDGFLSQGTSVDFLKKLTPLKMPGIGENLGTGLVFHSSFPSQNWQLHLTLDHSSRFSFGLSAQLLIVAGTDEINYQVTLDWGMQVLSEVLQSLGLTLRYEVG